MIAVDVGNSETVIGLFRGDALAGFWRLTSRPLTADEAALHLAALRGRGANWPERLQAVLCSVVPALTGPWAEALGRECGAPALEVNAGSAASLRIAYHDKASVGADRIANALAAREHYGLPAIVVDLGTATTFDCISAGGAYVGGVITPGVASSAEELFRRAARLPRVELKLPPRVMGKTTTESLQAGILYGAAGTVDALVRRLALEMKGTPHVIATGGLASVVAPACETVNVVDEALTLKGMMVLSKEHRSGAQRRKAARA
jgi:type III pantothenate kinase